MFSKYFDDFKPINEIKVNQVETVEIKTRIKSKRRITKR